jgi:simple sugar transport system ATP-binding protein
MDASTSETTEEELIRIVKSGLGRDAIAAAAQRAALGVAQERA